ncbi:envelope glycoprotein [Folsomia candida]|uniref:Envelope glycoprotein n=1 Tax=Folsomia candida TaxID=158441 RepID=A0A226CTI8_FOLCA|nr:envelope glycoprotein [Folsomia candida]
MALCPCNQRGEITANRIGEIQCNTESEAQHIARTCLGSLTLVRSQVDANGIRCESRLIDPEAILKAKQLPLKLQTGVLLTTDGAIRYEMTNAALLEVQLDATHLRIQKVIENVGHGMTMLRLMGYATCWGRDAEI